MKPARNVSPADIVKREIKARGGLRALTGGKGRKHDIYMRTIQHVLDGKPITPHYAGNLKIIFGIPAAFWLNLQASYDSRDSTEQHVTGSIGAIPQGIAASDSIEWDGERVIVKRRGAI